MTTILEAKKLNKVFQTGKEQTHHVLKDIDLSLKEGEFISVMGPSGSGKSTLLYSISGMDQISGGQVRFRDTELGGRTQDQLADIRLTKMGFIFQQSNFLKNLTIFDNIILAPYFSKRESRKKIQKRALDLMKSTGIEELADHDITQVSGGQLQRASICRALMNNPEILFGDEPTGALNSKAAGEVMDILRKINEAGTTILLVTHDAKIAAKTERILYMLDGKIVDEKYLGKYDAKKQDIRQRELLLSQWLTKLGY